MQVNLSNFLESKMEIANKLVRKLESYFDYASILGTDVNGKKISVNKTGVSLEDTMWADRGFVVRVYNGTNYSEHAFDTLSEENFDDVYNAILVTGKERAMKLNDTLDSVEYGVYEEEVLKQEFTSEINGDLRSLSYEDKINRLSDIMKKSCAISDEIVNVRVNYEEAHVSKIFISSKRELSQSYIWTVVGIIPIVSREGNIRYNIVSRSGLMGVDILDTLESIYEKAVKDAITLLDAKRIEPGEYTIICDPGVAGLIAHEAFGHGVEMDMFVKNRAKAEEYIGKEVASKKVVMKDGAMSAKEVASYFFDDEGVLGQDTTIIKDGILQAGISDLLSATKLGTQPTGNGRRQSYDRKAYARMTNTFFDKGDDSLEDMISSVKHGYLLEGFQSGMEDPKNWGIQCVILKTIEIVDGKLTDNIYSPVYLTGYVPDLLKSISMVSDTVKLSGSGYCGKGYKELVKTSTGGSYIKAVGRLS